MKPLSKLSRLLSQTARIERRAAGTRMVTASGRPDSNRRPLAPKANPAPMRGAVDNSATPSNADGYRHPRRGETTAYHSTAHTGCCPSVVPWWRWWAVQVAA